MEGLCEGLGRFEMYRFLGFVCLALVFSRFVFRFAKVCVDEMIDSYTLCKIMCCDSYVLGILNVGRMYMYIVFHVTCGCANVYFHLVSMCSPKTCVSACDARR